MLLKLFVHERATLNSVSLIVAKKWYEQKSDSFTELSEQLFLGISPDRSWIYILLCLSDVFPCSFSICDKEEWKNSIFLT